MMAQRHHSRGRWPTSFWAIAWLSFLTSLLIQAVSAQPTTVSNTQLWEELTQAIGIPVVEIAKILNVPPLIVVAIIAALLLFRSAKLIEDNLKD